MQFAVYQVNSFLLNGAVIRNNASALFLNSARNELGVRYAEKDYLACTTTSFCGGGGGGGGGGSPDFSMTPNPTSLTVIAGASATSSFTFRSLNGFSGSINFYFSMYYCSGFCFLMTDPSMSMNPSTVNLASGGSATSILAISSIDASHYPVSYTAQVQASVDNTPISHALNMSVSVTGDFGLTATPLSLSLPGYSTGTSTISVTGARFSGTVALTDSVAPVVAGGLNASLVPASLTVGYGATVTSTLTFSTTNTPPGRYIITVIGTSGSLSHRVSVSVVVPFPNDQLYGNQWGILDLNLPQAWQTTTGTHNRIIAIVDSGIMLDHPDLQGNLWTAPDGSHGWNCLPNQQNNNPSDDVGHGTEVAGIAAAVMNNGIGIAGTAQEQIMAIKVGDINGITTSTAACGIRWAVDHGANVVNLSIAVDPDQTLQNAINYAWTHGALLVAAAGNSGTGVVSCPACYSQVIAVSALQQGDTIAPYSSYGIGPPSLALSCSQPPPSPPCGNPPTPELTAPGDNIWTTNWPPNNIPGGCSSQLYCHYSGTSEAAPYVSGLAALAWDYNLQQHTNSFTNQQIRMALDTYVTTPSSANACISCANYYGFGKPDVAALLAAMAGNRSYTLTAKWSFGFSSGNEGSAGVLLQDITDPSNAKWITPCCTVPTVGNGLTVNIVAGHRVYVYFTSYFNDGSNSVYLMDVTPNHWANALGDFPVLPYYTDTNSLACGVNFVFPPVSATSQGDYGIAFAGNPYSGISCPQFGIGH